MKYDNQLILNGHGIIRGDEMLKTLYYIKKFIIQNPSEFIILTFQEEKQNALNDFSKYIFKQIIFDFFENIMITKKDTEEWFEIPKVTIGDIQKNKKNVLISFDLSFLEKTNHIYKNQKVHITEKGIFHKNKFFRDKWYDTENIEDLLSRNLEFLKETKKYKKDLIISQYVLTIQPKPLSLIKQFITFNAPTMKNLNMKMNENDNFILYLLKEIQNNQFNISKTD